MTDNEIIKACAELDGYNPKYVDGYYYVHPDVYPAKQFSYLTSYDAIIPLIQKQNHSIIMVLGHSIQQQCGTRYPYDATPRQLCEALLRATGRWVE